MNSFNKIVCILLTFSLVIYPFPHSTAYAGLEENKLAAESRINKYAKANELSIDTVKFTMAVSSLRQTILEENSNKKQIQAAIRRIQGELLKAPGIKIEEKIYKVKLQKSKSEAICLKVIFPGNEVRWLYFVKEPSILTENALRKFGVYTEEDRDYFLKGPLANVWISNDGPENRHGIGSRLASLSLTLLVACLTAPTPKCTFDVKWTNPEVTFIDAQPPYTDVYEGDVPPDITTADGVAEIEVATFDVEGIDAADLPPQNPAISIDEGDYTNSTTILLKLSVENAEEMRIYEPGGFDTGWIPYAKTYEFPLSPDDGPKTIYVKYKNSAGETNAVSDSVTLDTALPQIDITSPIDGFITNQPTVIVTGTYIETNMDSITVNGIPANLVNGSFSAEVPLQEGNNDITIEATDKAGNSTIKIIKVKYEPIQPPQNPDISINEGDYINTTTIHLTLTVAGAAEMRIYEPGGNDTGWIPYAPTYEFTVSSGDGVKIIYVKYRNSAGETNAVSDSVTLDTALPQIDITSPIDGFITNQPTIIVTGTYTETNLDSITVNGILANLVNGSFSAKVNLQEGDNNIIVEATDKAGNSTIKTIKVKYEPIQPPQNPAISINEGDYTNTTTINLTLTVAGAAEMRIYEPGGFDTGWIPYAPTYEFTISSGDGPKTIYVEYRNSAGETEAVSDSITLDTALPQIDITSPSDGFITDQPTIIVTGTYTETNLDSITVNGIPADLDLVNGSFSAEVQLQEGDNNIIVEATDKAGNSTKKIIAVTYIQGKDVYGTSIVCDNSQNVTILSPEEEFTIIQGTVSLNPDPNFVCGNNASYRLSKDAKISKELTQDEQDKILNNGITVITNGAKTYIKIKGIDSNGLEKTVIFKLKPKGAVDFENPKPYKFVISPSDLLQYFEQLISVEIQNLESNEDLILNGLLIYYAVATSSTTVQNPTQIGSYWTDYSSPGISATITPGENGIEISATLTAGSEQFVDIEITPIIKTLNNGALQSIATASSYFEEWWGKYDPPKANDGCYLADFEGQICEWASHGPLPQWIQLEWTNPITAYLVTLYDRKTPDWIKNGELNFNDGTKIQTGALPDEGYPNGKSFEFSPKEIKWVRLTITDSGGTPYPGLGEFEVFEAKDKTNFLTYAQQLLSNVTGNTPFVIELVDNKGKTISIPILTPNSTWQGVIADLLNAVQKNNPDLNLANIEKFRIIIPAKLIPVKEGQQYNVWLKIQGYFVKIGTRGEYATDPDLTEEEKKSILGKIPSDKLQKIIPEDIEIPVGYNIYGVKDIDIVTPLGFKIGSRIISAFFDEKDIYIPHPDLIKEMFQGYPEHIKTTLLATAKKRLEIVLGHELDEASGIKDHAEVVLNEFSKHHINGLNYADIATILFKSLTGTIDTDFHERFLSNLFMQGMGLFMTPQTYTRIIKEMIDPRADEKEIESIYKTILTKFDHMVTTTIRGKEFTYNAYEFDYQATQFQDEPGFSKLIKEPSSQKTEGAILVDLNRFLIKNTSLSSAVTINTEYLKRFIAFARMLPQGVKITGLTEKDKSDIIIAQLLAIINTQLPDGKFHIIDNINFSDYMATIETGNTITILTEETLGKIPDNIKAQLKIVVPANLGYNRVTDAGYEFYAAWEGLDKNRDEFVNLIHQIATELIEHLFRTKKITEEERDTLLKEIEKSIRTSGIGFIPSWYDPIQYYKNIESQKALLIAA